MQLPNDLIISISGVRGKNPGSLTPAVAYNLTLAFCQVAPHGPIVLSRDSRPSGLELKKAIIEALTDSNRKILDADLIPLPTTQMAIEKSKAAGGIDITASHNPIEWNGLKFLGSNGRFIQQETLDKILTNIAKLPDTRQIPTKPNKTHLEEINEQAINWHIEALKKYFVKGRHLTVAVDAVNGSGSRIVPKLLEAMDCTVLPIAINPEEPFPHTPEPTPNNLAWTQTQLEGQEYDLCVVVDPDADRLALIDSDGNLIAEEATAPLVVQELVGQGRSGNVVINMSTSRMMEDLGRKENFEVIRSEVGEINVVNEMIKSNAFFGAEGNGGIIDPQIHYGRDSLVGIVFILNLMRWTNQSLAELVDNLPKYVMEKTKVTLPAGANLESIYQKIEDHFKAASVNRKDGLRLDWPSQWVHIRPSNTEPVVRIIGEAPTKAELDTLLRACEDIVLS